MKTIIYYLVSFLAGATAIIQAGVNGQLKTAVGGPVLASLISFFVGTLTLGIVFTVSVINGYQLLPSPESLQNTHWWMWIGGILGAFFVFVSILCVPKIGFACMFCLMITGQILISLIFDHFGAFGNSIYPMNPYRALGAIMLIGGVYLIQTH
ncbi:DMT family transporter [Dehalobacterium formicoaceticum]|uniref:DMT family transporter n=1 Tax=Dehalobacterium formicoaceticum TaxID=51515 RepID=A0ABT1XZJ5_9FIRM|nr:DMT family transporter [Dehalobacterium formicoaceticum]MCR6544042.1 DMT family transporter [Dehalobacterium formicoaceticum]